MKHITLVTIIIVIIFGACTNSNRVEKEETPIQNHFISFTDLHFNPFADTSLVKILDRNTFNKWDSIFQNSKLASIGSYGEESNYQLFTEALYAMQKHNNNPDFLVIAGDFICHDFGANYKKITGNSNNEDMHAFLKKTMQFLLFKIESTYPNSTIFPTLGNNDAYCGDYQIDMNGEYLGMFAELFYSLINKGQDNPQIIQDLKTDGFYMASNPVNPKHKIISFNSILFTPKYQSSKYERNCECEEANQDSLVKVQFDWLTKQLEVCRQNNNPVWLLTHVPPGIDIYATLKSDNPVTYWNEKYIDTFKNIINKYSATIKLTIVGHTHMDDFKIIFNNEAPESFIHITPSISPVFDNNPAYQVIFYDISTADYTNYISYNIDLTDSLPEWNNEYNFENTYGEFNFNPTGLNQFYQKLNSNEKFQQIYFDNYSSGSKASSFITNENWYAYKCGMVNITNTEFEQCVK